MWLALASILAVLSSTEQEQRERARIQQLSGRLGLKRQERELPFMLRIFKGIKKDRPSALPLLVRAYRVEDFDLNVWQRSDGVVLRWLSEVIEYPVTDTWALMEAAQTFEGFEDFREESPAELKGNLLEDAKGNTYLDRLHTAAGRAAEELEKRWDYTPGWFESGWEYSGDAISAAELPAQGIFPSAWSESRVAPLIWLGSGRLFGLAYTEQLGKRVGTFDPFGRYVGVTAGSQEEAELLLFQWFELYDSIVWEVLLGEEHPMPRTPSELVDALQREGLLLYAGPEKIWTRGKREPGYGLYANVEHAWDNSFVASLHAMWKRSTDLGHYFWEDLLKEILMSEVM